VNFLPVREGIILLVLAALPAIGEGFCFRDKISWQSAIPASELVTVDQARAWGDGAIWVDARPDDEYAKDHVPGAFSLNEDRWNELFPAFRERWSPDRKIIVYCSAESCNLARDVAKKLREEEQLPNDIRVLQGGWEAWVKKNR
jgi:rhodanese-related sulfurtransferase